MRLLCQESEGKGDFGTLSTIKGSSELCETRWKQKLLLLLVSQKCQWRGWQWFYLKHLVVFFLTKLSPVAVSCLLPWPRTGGAGPSSDPRCRNVTSLSSFCPHPGLCHDALSLREGLPPFCIPQFSQHVAQYGESRRGIQRHPVHQPRMTVRSRSEDGTKSKPVAWLFHIWLFKKTAEQNAL